MKARYLPLLCVLVGLGGCSNGGDLFPLKIGNEWSYSISNGFSSSVEPLKVVRSVPVADVNGFELQGPMGMSRLAWRGSTLYASVLPNTRFAKPIPLVVSNEPKAVRSWDGTMEAAGKTVNVSATLKQNPESIDVGTHKFDAIKAVLTIDVATPKGTIELETYYAKGIGILKQVQRTNGKLDVGLEYLSGP
jgi:hypothetical protein